jgi:hypothetical protein
MMNLIVDILYSIVIVAALVYIVNLRAAKMRMAKALIKTSVDLMLLREELEKANAARETQSVEGSDGFLKFISESRDWAFDYIEKVQDGLKTFAKTAGKEVKYLDTYGRTIETPFTNSINTIVKAYEELETLLPKEDVK